MSCGYFGKLPARSDFVIGQCPKGFLKLWEPFLMQGLAQSRLDLEEAWKEAYMTMPVWRFRIWPGDNGTGSERLPKAVAGAFMPSVDKVGREFPLTLVAAAEGTEGVAMEDWFNAAEAILLGALREEARLEDFQNAIADLEPPAVSDGGELLQGAARLAPSPESDGTVRSRFMCSAGETEFVFDCGGLPAADTFRWLMLPEHHSAPEGLDAVAGKHHGRSHPEDHRT
jgi:type VI secretion system protein ImpM